MSQQWSGLAQDIREEALHRPSPNNASAPDQSLRILIADDDPSIVEMLEARIGLSLDIPIDLLTCHSAEDALELLHGGPVDLLLTDYDFSQSSAKKPMNGLELLRELSRLDIVVTPIFMTGFGDEGVAKEAIRSGAFDYLTKPALSGLDDVLKATVAEHSRRRENAQLRNAATLLELNQLLSSRERAGEGLERLLDAVAQESDCDLVWALLRQPGDRQHSLRLSRRREQGPSVPATEALASFDPGMIARELEESERAELFGADLVPARVLIHPLLLPAPSHGSPEPLGYLAIVYKDRGHRLHPGRQRAIQLLVQPCENVLSQRFLHHRTELASRQTIEVLVRALELHDEYTAGHSDWVSIYARLIAIAKGWSPRQVERAGYAGLLHDIGKVRLDNSVINHAGPLSREQRSHFQQHPAVGMEMLKPLESMKDLLPAVYSHHERFEGGGYPEGVPSAQLSDLARLTCIADAYDAMTSHRAYRRALTHDQAIKELRRWSGRQFDPALVQQFSAALQQFRRLAQAWIRSCLEEASPCAMRILEARLEGIVDPPISAEELCLEADEVDAYLAAVNQVEVDAAAVLGVLLSMEDKFQEGAKRLFSALDKGVADAPSLEAAMEELTNQSDHRITRLIVQTWEQDR